MRAKPWDVSEGLWDGRASLLAHVPASASVTAVF
jgi:hypothetical protein